MQHPGFFDRAGPFTLDVIATAIGAKLNAGIDGSRTLDDVRPLQNAGPHDVTFFDNRKYLSQLCDTAAGACILAHSFATRLPKATVVLTSPTPYRSFARALSLFYSDALRSKAAKFAADSELGFVHRSARIGDGAIIEPGAIIGQGAIIGADTTIAAGSVIGYRVVVGSNCYVGANCTVTHSILGDGVIIHPGVRIGQDGFGFALGAKGHEKIPQIGRVLIGDDVEIGANSTIDRGSLTDTVIGAGTKIDNLVQIGHNVVIGRNCVIVAMSGIAGSTKLGDFVVMGAQSIILGHVVVGDGAQIAARATVKSDVQPRARMGGSPAVPFKDWARELATIKRLSRKRTV
jgi:UDP-3-O-[3-hydroxymyristoyl] glucosamine N-acyltransferase